MSATRLTALLCLAQVLGMAGFATFATLLPDFVQRWSLSNTEAGWISAAYFVGYVMAVPLLVGVTDRVDGRRVYVLGLALSGLAGLGFASLAEGLWSAVALRWLAGVGLAGTYMPGLRVLGDRVSGEAQLRAVPWYTGFFSVGSAASYLLAETMAGARGWEAAFVASGLLPLLAAALVAWRVAPVALPAGDGPRRALLDFRPVLAERGLLGWCLMYGGHTWELLALRAWLVAFLVFSLSLQPAGGLGLEPGTITALVVLTGMPASVLVAELALRRRRLTVVRNVMIVSALLSVLFGASAGAPFWVVIVLAFVYNGVIMADSGSLTAGAMAATPQRLRGAMLSVYSLVGFSGGVVGPLAVGAVLDLLGGADDAGAWLAAMAAVGAGSALALLALPLASRRR